MKPRFVGCDIELLACDLSISSWPCSSRPSTPLNLHGIETWVAGTSPAMTRQGLRGYEAAREGQMRRRAFLVLVGGTVASSLALRRAAAQAYPTRPVTLVIPFPPGGGNDALGRMVADKMSKSLGQQIVVDNRGGAGGTIATRAVARSAPDGYTILLAYTGTLAINPSLYANPGYDPRKDLAPIGLIAGLPSVLVVHPTLPVRSVAELIAFAKARPGRIDYAFVPGTVGHITTELFANIAGIEITRIPYKGNGPAMTDLLGGHVSMMFLSILPVLEHVRAGTLNALAVTSAARSELLPEVPTIAQAGVPGFSAVIHYGLLAPPGAPRDIIARLNAALREALSADDVRARLAAEGAVPLPGTPEDYAADIDGEETKWGALVRRLNLKVE
jgi:tripartite-type tricarboxylate transporter receptor subunit TctC